MGNFPLVTKQQAKCSEGPSSSHQHHSHGSDCNVSSCKITKSRLLNQANLNTASSGDSAAWSVSQTDRDWLASEQIECVSCDHVCRGEQQYSVSGRGLCFQGSNSHGHFLFMCICRVWHGQAWQKVMMGGREGRFDSVLEGEGLECLFGLFKVGDFCVPVSKQYVYGRKSYPVTDSALEMLWYCHWSSWSKQDFMNKTGVCDNCKNHVCDGGKMV